MSDTGKLFMTVNEARGHVAINGDPGADKQDDRTIMAVAVVDFFNEAWLDNYDLTSDARETDSPFWTGFEHHRWTPSPEMQRLQGRIA